MTTTVVNSDSSEGEISSDDVTYATCVAGAALAVNNTNTDMHVLENNNFSLWHSYVQFDTSSIPDTDVVSAAVLKLHVAIDSSTTDFVVEAFIFDFGATLTTADWQNASQVGALTRVATWATSTGGAFATFTSDATFPAQINKTGFTRLILCVDRFRLGTQPSVQSYMDFHTKRDGTSANWPELTITHDAIAVGRRPVFRRY